MQQGPAAFEPTSWQIVTYRDADDAPPRYAVVHGGRRVAWGLRERASAARWLRRLSAPVQPLLRLDAIVAAWQQIRDE